MHCSLFAAVVLSLLAMAGCTGKGNGGDAEWRNYSARFVRDKINTEAVLPDSVFDAHGDTVPGIRVMSMPGKVLFCVDVECGVCLAKFHYWKEFVRKFRIRHGKDAPVLAVVSSERPGYAARIVEENWGLDWVYDPGAAFIDCNDLEDDRFQAVLLDGENVVRILGNPMFNESLGVLYENTLSRFLGE